VDVLLDEDAARVVVSGVEDVAKVDPAERLGAVEGTPTAGDGEPLRIHGSHDGGARLGEQAHGVGVGEALGHHHVTAGEEDGPDLDVRVETCTQDDVVRRVVPLNGTYHLVEPENRCEGARGEATFGRFGFVLHVRNKWNNNSLSKQLMLSHEICIRCFVQSKMNSIVNVDKN
jgi:hypothetical protein